MPYIVTNSDGSSTITVADSTVDTGTYSLALIGRNVANYGQYFAQNTIRQLENFASTTAPNPGTTLEGQLWYNKTEQQLSVWQGSTWKRIGVVVGSDNQKPTQFRTSGTSFFNTTTDKLEIWNKGWQEAAYGGTVTDEFSSDSSIQSPTTYGTRLRTLFFKEASTDNMLPVLALVYTKSPQINPTDPTSNRGSTEVPSGSGNYETIMAFWSDFDFYVNSGGTDSPVNGSIVDYYNELVEVDSGILAARAGRSTGQVFKGLNQRAEYEGSSIATFDSVFITSALGSASLPVPEGYFSSLTIGSDITVQTLTVNNDGSVGGQLTVTGNITSTSGTINTTDLVVTNSSILNGTTTINGSIVVNGVNSQTLGTVTEVIEDSYFGNVTAANATINNLTVTGDVVGLSVAGLESSGDVVIQTGSTLIIQDTIQGSIANVTTLDASTSGATHYLTFGTSDLDSTAQPLNTDSGINYVPNTGTLSATTFSGTATSAEFADLAEIYSTDAVYLPGTVVTIGGAAEITLCTEDASTDVFGVVSTDPAYLMNSKAEGVAVALQGRVPVRVIGSCSKGDRLVSAGEGVARTIGNTPYDPRMVIGRALSGKSSQAEDFVETVVGVK